MTAIRRRYHSLPQLASSVYVEDPAEQRLRCVGGGALCEYLALTEISIVASGVNMQSTQTEADFLVLSRSEASHITFI